MDRGCYRVGVYVTAFFVGVFSRRLEFLFFFVGLEV